MQPGDWLAIFTDGVIEAENRYQQEYSGRALHHHAARGRDANSGHVTEYRHG